MHNFIHAQRVIHDYAQVYTMGYACIECFPLIITAKFSPNSFDVVHHYFPRVLRTFLRLADPQILLFPTVCELPVFSRAKVEKSAVSERKPRLLLIYDSSLITTASHFLSLIATFRQNLRRRSLLWTKIALFDAYCPETHR
jgi:hypothetical protein